MKFKHEFFDLGVIRLTDDANDKRRNLHLPENDSNLTPRARSDLSLAVEASYSLHRELINLNNEFENLSRYHSRMLCFLL